LVALLAILMDAISIQLLFQFHTKRPESDRQANKQAALLLLIILLTHFLTSLEIFPTRSFSFSCFAALLCL